jgi:hypothetical protein
MDSNLEGFTDMNLETLQQKRAVLVAQKEQILANLNASLGAIGMMDELIGEAAAEESRRLATEAPPVVLDPTEADLVEKITWPASEPVPAVAQAARIPGARPFGGDGLCRRDAVGQGRLRLVVRQHPSGRPRL